MRKYRERCGTSIGDGKTHGIINQNVIRAIIRSTNGKIIQVKGDMV